MDKLKLAYKIVGKACKKKRDSGSVPTFLGVRGMLALMYQNIVDFNGEEEDYADYVIDLAANAIFAVTAILPNMDEEFLSPEDDEELAQHRSSSGKRQRQDSNNEDTPTSEETEVAEEEEDDSGRWTKIPAGKPLRSITTE